MTPFKMAKKFQGVKEIPGNRDNPIIMSFLTLYSKWPQHDEVAWCSASVAAMCWLTNTEHSKSLVARSWLQVGAPIIIDRAEQGYDIIIIETLSNSPGPYEYTQTGAHVGFYVFHDADYVWLLSGNQGNEMSISRFRRKDILGVRRLSCETHRRE